MVSKIIDRGRLIKIKEYYLRNGLKRILYIEAKNFEIKIVYELTEYLTYKNGIKIEKEISSLLCFLTCKKCKNKESKINQLNIKYFLPLTLESLNVEEKTKNKLREVILLFLNIKIKGINKEVFRNRYFSLILPYTNRIKPIEEDYIIPIIIDLFSGIKTEKGLKGKISNKEIEKEIEEDLNSSIINLIFYIKWGLYKHFIKSKKVDKEKEVKIYKLIKKRVNSIYIEYIKEINNIRERSEKLDEKDKDILTMKSIYSIQETNSLLNLKSSKELKELINNIK